MGIQIGPWDPLKLSLNILNQLLQRGLLTYDDAHSIIFNSLSENMTKEQKETYINTILTKK